MITYEQARKDHEYLWKTYGSDEDMTGAYVDSDDLERLLKNPAKTTARQCYADQIRYWFEAGPDPSNNGDGRDWRSDPIVSAISDRYGCESYARA